MKAMYSARTLPWGSAQSAGMVGRMQRRVTFSDTHCAFMARYAAASGWRKRQREPALQLPLLTKYLHTPCIALEVAAAMAAGSAAAPPATHATEALASGVRNTGRSGCVQLRPDTLIMPV